MAQIFQRPQASIPVDFLPKAGKKSPFLEEEIPKLTLCNICSKENPHGGNEGSKHQHEADEEPDPSPCRGEGNVDFYPQARQSSCSSGRMEYLISLKAQLERVKPKDQGENPPAWSLGRKNIPNVLRSWIVNDTQKSTTGHFKQH